MRTGKLMKGIGGCLLAFLFLFHCHFVLAQSSTHYSIGFGVISGGGGEGGSTNYSLYGIFGQPSAIGVSTSTGYINRGGFLYLFEPDISLSLSAWNFERVFVGQSSPPQGFTITNPGTGELAIGTLSVTGSSEFHLQNDHCSNQVLEAFATCDFEVLFSPTSLGSKTATLEIPSNDEDSPLTLALSGRGVRLMVNPEEGTIGTSLTIGGSGFGAKKGKIWIGGVSLKVQNWGSEAIEGTLTKTLSPSPYDVVVVPKEPKDAPSITEPGGFTVRAPEIQTVNPTSGKPLDEITILGNFFSTKKGKVYLEKDGETKSCKVTEWKMTKVKFLVAKGLAPGVHTLRVTNKVGSGIGTFTVED